MLEDMLLESLKIYKNRPKNVSDLSKAGQFLKEIKGYLSGTISRDDFYSIDKVSSNDSDDALSKDRFLNPVKGFIETCYLSEQNLKHTGIVYSHEDYKKALNISALLGFGFGLMGYIAAPKINFAASMIVGAFVTIASASIVSSLMCSENRRALDGLYDALSSPAERYDNILDANKHTILNI